MSALAYQQNGYLSATKTTGVPLKIEYQVFSKVTGQLNRATQEGAHFSDLAHALDENLKLWQALALDVMRDENGLPPQLRAQLFYLYKFTREHSRKVLRREADAQALIDINTSIMRGLRQAAQNEGAE